MDFTPAYIAFDNPDGARTPVEVGHHTQSFSTSFRHKTDKDGFGRPRGDAMKVKRLGLGAGLVAAIAACIPLVPTPEWVRDPALVGRDGKAVVVTSRTASSQGLPLKN